MKLIEVVDLIEPYNFCLELFSLEGQSKGQMRTSPTTIHLLKKIYNRRIGYAVLMKKKYYKTAHLLYYYYGL